MWLVAGVVGTAAHGDFNAVVSCAGGKEAKTKVVVLKSLDDVTFDPSGGLQVRGRAVSTNKLMRPELKQCRDYYWKARWGYDSEGNSEIQYDRVKRDWNAVTMKVGGPLILACAAGSSLNVIEDMAEWKIAVARQVYAPPPISMLPPTTAGEETISDVSCLVD